VLPLTAQQPPPIAPRLIQNLCFFGIDNSTLAVASLLGLKSVVSVLLGHQGGLASGSFGIKHPDAARRKATANKARLLYGHNPDHDFRVA